MRLVGLWRAQWTATICILVSGGTPDSYLGTIVMHA